MYIPGRLAVSEKKLNILFVPKSDVKQRRAMWSLGTDPARKRLWVNIRE
jgi:hypothetical protein